MLSLAGFEALNAFNLSNVSLHVGAVVRSPEYIVEYVLAHLLLIL